MPTEPTTFDQLLVLSDIHLPLENKFSSYAGKDLLGPALQAWCPAKKGSLLVLNGDVLDLLTDKSDLDPEGVAAAARRVIRILTRPPGVELTKALRKLLAGGATVVIRPGNHDLELAHPEVQDAFRRAVRQKGDLHFSSQPMDTYTVGGLQVVVAHGEQDDVHNAFDYDKAREGTFVYPPGSKLVKAVVNDAKAEGLHFIDQMTPLEVGAIATAKLINPDAVALNKAEALDILGQLARRTLNPLAMISLRQAMTGIARWITSGGEASELVGGLQPFPALEDLRPDDKEAALVRWCADRYAKADVVILGHTHQPRLADLRSAVYANPGSWTWRLAGPGAEEGPDAWATFLALLKADPTQTGDAAHLKVRQPGAVRVNGRTVELLRWRDDRPHAVRVVPTQRQPLAAAPDHAFTRASATDARLDALRAAVAERLQPGVAQDLTDLLLPTRLRHLMLTLVHQALDADGPDRAIRAETVWRLYEEARADRLAAREADKLRHCDALAREGYGVVRAVAPAAGFSVHDRAEEPLIRLVPAASPLTWRREQELQLTRGLEQYDYVNVSLDALPFPVVTFPPNWLAQPRWATILLHELGHDLDADLDLTPALQAAKWTKDVPDGLLWSSWTSEIVADLMMLALAGPPAVRVLDEVLADVLGHPGLAHLDGPHPPAVLRVELLRHASAALFGAEGEISADRIAERDRCDRDLIASAENAAAALLQPKPADSKVPAFGDLLRAIAAADRPRCQAIASGAKPPDDAQDDSEAVGAWTTLAEKWLKEAAPTYGLDPDTLHKSPPHALLVQHDRAALIGETNNQLPDALKTAFRLRGDKRWTRLEVFYLAPAGVAAMATDARPFDDRWTARQASLAHLRKLLPKYCESFQLYEHNDASLFASFWGPADDNAPWTHVHTSARVWGGEIQRAPAVDYRWHPNRPNLQLKALAEGLAWLRKTAKKLPARVRRRRT